ncbi:MAG: glycosyltransferase family 2 protein [Ignavibacteriales bacterium]
MRRILVMPQYNEERTVIGVLESASRFVDRIIIVNDGSTDSSQTLIEEWMDSRPGVALINLAANQGMSGALLAGFCEVYRLYIERMLGDDDIIINIDADGQHKAEEIPRMVEALHAKKADVLLARRDLSGYPLFKQVGNKGLSAFASFLSGVRYFDVECGFRFMRVKVIPGLLKYFTGRRYGCAQEIGMITALLGFAIDNTEPAEIAYYRAGARVTDGLVNIGMGFLAYARVKLGLANDLERLVGRVLGHAKVCVSPLLDAGRTLSARANAGPLGS